MKIVIVLVHYHTPDLLERAISALLRDAEASGLELEGVIVDNGSRPEDVALLGSQPFRVLTPGGNLGYAGGVNLGLKSTQADLAVVMNPDVEVLPGCLRQLVDELERGAVVVGPRFYWDADRLFQLPPTEVVGLGAELGRLLAGRGGLWCRRARRRWRRHSRRFFQARESLPSYDLSGALLALRREAWATVGPLDERYALYFEETDWLQRMKRAGKPCRFVPGAEAVHLYAQSTVKEGQAQRWFEASQRRFRQQFYGRRWTHGLEYLASKLTNSPRTMSAIEQSSANNEQAVWLEVAASPKGFPAATRWLDGGLGQEELSDAVPPDIQQRMAPGTYYLRTVDAKGRELSLRTFEVPDLGTFPS